MKELSIEEKAARYDEAIKFAKIYYNSGDEDMKTMCKTMFSELKEESEDDKIRKWLIEMVEEVRKANPINADFNEMCSEAKAWLERQGTSYTKRDVDDAYLKGVTSTKNEIEKQYEATYQIRKDIATFIFNYRGDIKDRAKWMDYLGIKVSFVEIQGGQ